MNSKISVEPEFPWLEWNLNSCRYDSFITIFALGLYKKFKSFDIGHSDGRHKFKNQYISLCNLAESISTIPCPTRNKMIIDFWEKMWRTGIDSNEPTKMGYVQDLLNLFLPLFNIQPFIQITQNCTFCESICKRKKYVIPCLSKYMNSGALNIILFSNILIG